MPFRRRSNRAGRRPASPASPRVARAAGLQLAPFFTCSKPRDAILKRLGVKSDACSSEVPASCPCSSDGCWRRCCSWELQQCQPAPCPASRNKPASPARPAMSAPLARSSSSMAGTSSCTATWRPRAPQPPCPSPQRRWRHLPARMPTRPRLPRGGSGATTMWRSIRCRCSMPAASPAPSARSSR